jgi:hypothetical protein
MFKQLFQFKADGAAGDGTSGTGTFGDRSVGTGSAGSGSAGRGSATNGSSFSSLKAAEEAERVAAEGTERGRKGVDKAPVERRTNGELQSFEEIYRNAPVKPPKVAYSSLGILRVVDMVHSPHLAGMSAEAKRNSVLMALEAVGVKVEDLLQDAMVRQRALNDYEESQETKLKDFESAKTQENSVIRAELDRLSAAHLARIQENLDLVARHHDNLRMWTKRKEQESEQIAEAASFCTPQTAGGGGSLTATVTRFGADAVVGKASDGAAAGKR